MVRKTYQFPEELHEKILTEQGRRGLDSESAAARQLIRQGLREDALWYLVFLLQTKTLEEISEEHPQVAETFRASSIDHFSTLVKQMEGDLIEEAGGVENLSAEEIDAVRRVSTEGTSVSFGHLITVFNQVLPRVAERGDGQLQRFAAGFVSGLQGSQEEAEND